MEGNAYTNLLKIMREEGYNKDISARVAKVISVSPLKIAFNGFEIDREDCFLSETVQNLIDDHIGYVTVTHLSGMGDAEVEEKAELKPRSKLEVGDALLVFIEGSDFYVVDRMV